MSSLDTTKPCERCRANGATLDSEWLVRTALCRKCLEDCLEDLQSEASAMAVPDDNGIDYGCLMHIAAAACKDRMKRGPEPELNALRRVLKVVQKRRDVDPANEDADDVAAMIRELRGSAGASGEETLFQDCKLVLGE